MKEWAEEKVRAAVMVLYVAQQRHEVGVLGSSARWTQRLSAMTGVPCLCDFWLALT